MHSVFQIHDISKTLEDVWFRIVPWQIPSNFHNFSGLSQTNQCLCYFGRTSVNFEGKIHPSSKMSKWFAQSTKMWGFPKMMVPNNHWFSYYKWSFWGGVPRYHHLRKHPCHINSQHPKPSPEVKTSLSLSSSSAQRVLHLRQRSEGLLSRQPRHSNTRGTETWSSWPQNLLYWCHGIFSICLTLAPDFLTIISCVV